MPNWDKYRIRRREKVEIDNVPHIAHLPTAQRIIEDGRINSGRSRPTATRYQLSGLRWEAQVLGRLAIDGKNL